MITKKILAAISAIRIAGSGLWINLLPENGPGGLVPASLNEEAVEGDEPLIG